MNQRTLISTVILSLWLGTMSAAAVADTPPPVPNQDMQGMNMSNMDNQGKDMKPMPTATHAQKERPDLIKDKKCLDKHKNLMDKPGVKNGVKCRQAHGYKMKDNKVSAAKNDQNPEDKK